MAMPGRKFTATNVYRYGFNGKENDKEVTSTSTYDYGFRIYNPALGRFLSIDPLVPKFPFYTPFQFASNNPITSIDLDGLESVINISGTSSPEKMDSKIKNTNADVLHRMAKESSMITNLVNSLVPQLILPQSYVSNFTSEEKSSIITETINDFLSFNFNETLSGNVDGSESRTFTLRADLNYTLIFGDKSSQFIDEVKSSFEMLSTVNGSLSSPIAMAGKKVKHSFSTLDYGVKIFNGQYADVAKDAIGQVATNLIEKGVDKAIEAGLLKTTATVIAPRLLGTIANGLIPLTAYAPTPQESKQAAKAFQTKQLVKNVIGSLLFYFMNNNQLGTKEKDISQSKAVTDHPEDTKNQRRYKNE